MQKERTEREMSIKNELILSYIKELDAGTKISVRKLSELLDVSVGTVYKAIKSAEAQGLVVTKPKSGTFRVDAANSGETEPMNFKRMAKLLGLTVIIEPADVSRDIARIVICDGSEQQLQNALLGNDNSDVLCIVGNRPEMQAIAVERGANLLLTGGASAEPLTLIRAERGGLGVMSALQDSYTVMRLIEKARCAVAGDTDEAQDWMKTPNYLYTNDVVADWHKLCESIAPAIPSYPVVDENLKLCGMLDVPKAFAANPSQRIYGIMRRDKDIMHFDAQTPMYRIAEEMMLAGSNLAAVTDGDKMSGVIDASDLLRYFMFSGRKGEAPMFESFLESADITDDVNERYYKIRLPKSGREDASEFTLPVVLTAALRHASELLGAGCVIESGTFFASKTIEWNESLMLSSKLTRRGEQGCTLEEEIFDDSYSYTKAVLMFTAKQGE